MNMWMSNTCTRSCFVASSPSVVEVNLRYAAATFGGDDKGADESLASGQAMAAGLPVIAVAAGGLLDIMTQPGVTGDTSGRNFTPSSTLLARQHGHHVALPEH
jgi:hypothetical protein